MRIDDSMEILSDILRMMRVQGSIFFCDDREAPWSQALMNPTATCFHVVRRGECWVTGAHGSDRLGAGDMVVIGAGREHVLSSDPPGQSARDPGAVTLLLCGYWEFQQQTILPLDDLLPRYCVVRADELAKAPWLRSTLDQLSAEYLSQQPGSRLVVDKLTEIVVVELIRIGFGRSGKSRLIQALADRHVASALERLHRHPEHPWTIARLAEDVGLSRAALARRFRELVGQPVFEYLTRIRLQHAKEILRDSSMPVWEVASRVGYDSEVSFTRTFRKFEGRTPRQFRKMRS